MGRGDKKTAKGKRAMGSYGNTRKRKSSTPVVKPAAKKETVKKAEAPAEKKPAAKKAAAPKAAAEKKPAAKKTTKKAEK